MDGEAVLWRFLPAMVVPETLMSEPFNRCFVNKNVTKKKDYAG
jgi:hypothetical protein